MSNLVAIIADTHFGARGDNPLVQTYFTKFYSDVFFPYLEQKGIKHIIHCGDLVDRRKFINFSTAMSLHQTLSNPLQEKGMTMDVIVGNHDVSYKNTNKTNALTVLYNNNYSNIRCFIEPTIVNYNNVSVCLLPWITADNKQESYKTINNTTSRYCFGHLELAGFETYKGHIIEEGADSKPFKKFEHVFTGHYHHRSTIDNISYIGAPYEMVWSDYDDERGFAILDLDSGHYEFVNNPHKLFHKIYYNEKTKSTLGIDIDFYKNTFIKVIVENKHKEKLFNLFLDKLDRIDPIDIQVIDQQKLVESSNTVVDTAQLEDTTLLLQKYVEDATLQCDKHAVTTMLLELYRQACEIE